MPNHITNILTIKGEPKLIDALIEKLSTENEETDFGGKKTGKMFTREFDFNTIIPMPESMHITSGTATKDAMALIKAEKGDMSEIEKIADYPWVTNHFKNNNDYFLAPENIQKEMRVMYVLTEKKSNISDKAMEEGQIALDNIEKYGCTDWYEFANKFWGTKWNAYDIEVTRNSEDTVTYQFDTAWACPMLVIEALGEQNPELTISISFADEDLGHNCGEFKIVGSALIEQNMPEGGSDEAYTLASKIKGYGADYFMDSLNYMDEEEIAEDGWANTCLEQVYGEDVEGYDCKPFVLDALEKMAIAKEDFEYAQKIKEAKEKLPKE